MASKSNFPNFLQGNRLSRGLMWGILILGALTAFEIFNYSTTDFAMSDLLGDLKFLGLRWSTILAIVFCGIDFAGIARLFTPEQGADEPNEVWYLFGAWLLAATMNAALTWWGVSIAIINHQTLGNEVVSRETLLKVVPIFVAVIVWLIRVLIIGTFSVAGDRLFSQDDSPSAYRGLQMRSSKVRSQPQNVQRKPRPSTNYSRTTQNQRPAAQTSFRPSATRNRPEPTYHPISMQSKPKQSSKSSDYNNPDYMS